uniref:Putative secreted protein n=1 Tax=Anopheles darlingi TaxID=43151 RepID=A0A2M4DFT8_ANODA
MTSMEAPFASRRFAMSSALLRIAISNAPSSSSAASTGSGVMCLSNVRTMVTLRLLTASSNGVTPSLFANRGLAPYLSSSFTRARSLHRHARCIGVVRKHVLATSIP